MSPRRAGTGHPHRTHVRVEQASQSLALALSLSHPRTPRGDVERTSQKVRCVAEERRHVTQQSFRICRYLHLDNCESIRSRALMLAE